MPSLLRAEFKSAKFVMCRVGYGPMLCAELTRYHLNIYSASIEEQFANTNMLS